MSLDDDRRKRRAKLASEIWPQRIGRREFANGHEFRLEFNPSLFASIAKLATLEHLCYPFFEIALKLEKNGGPLLLQITGDPDVKRFLQAELNL